jgi:hypothetical protein
MAWGQLLNLLLRARTARIVRVLDQIADCLRVDGCCCENDFTTPSCRPVADANVDVHDGVIGLPVNRTACAIVLCSPSALITSSGIGLPAFLTASAQSIMPRYPYSPYSPTYSFSPEYFLNFSTKAFADSSGKVSINDVAMTMPSFSCGLRVAFSRPTP